MIKKILWWMQRDEESGGYGDFLGDGCTNGNEALAIAASEFKSLADCDKRRIINLFVQSVTVFWPETAEERRMMEKLEDTGDIIKIDIYDVKWYVWAIDGGDALTSSVYYIKDGEKVLP